MNGRYDIVYGDAKLILFINIVFYVHAVVLVITWSNMHELLINYKYYTQWGGLI